MPDSTNETIAKHLTNTRLGWDLDIIADDIRYFSAAERAARLREAAGRLATTPPAAPAALLPNWHYPLFATCSVCHETLQFDIDPNGTPGQNGDWSADGDYGCITGDDDGSDGHTPVSIRWAP